MTATANPEIMVLLLTFLLFSFVALKAIEPVVTANRESAKKK
jgi:hypothetical protein